jgi:D-alanyl-D-alanine carboxypeptidase
MNKSLLIWGGVAAGAFVLIFGGYYLWELRAENTLLQGQVSELQQSLTATNNGLVGMTEKNTTLATNLQSEQTLNGAFGSEIQSLSGTVGTLQKLSVTDKELLEKYSKVYFLNENYVPQHLTNIDPQYAYDQSKVLQIHTGVAPFLQSMISAAGRDGVSLLILSAYRSFGQQAALKFGYVVTYGAGSANQFSADQGYSEHQLGTAVDFTTPQVKADFSKFASSTAYQWLTDNAYRFGFILSYPPHNTYYQFERWHWRFVGTALATNLHDTNRYFYDLDQREIDQYLVSIFD